MTSVLFICHGNICRSTMAEFVMKDILAARGMGDVRVESAATSREELGNDTYPGTKRVLDAHGVPYAPRRARQTTRDDYDAFDYIVGMDAENMRGMRRIYGGDPEGKLSLLLDWTGVARDVADPWYTRDFDATFDDVEAGCTALAGHLERTLGR